MSTQAARVLLIEDEAVLRSSMVRGLQKLPGVEIVHAGTLTEGLALLDAAATRLVISDIDLPDRSGLELIGEIGRRSIVVPVVLMSAYLKAFRSQIPPHANVEVLEKPVGIDELRALVQRHISAGIPTSSDSSPFGVADYMQLSSLGRHSVTIDVSGCGRIVIYQGFVWSASDAQGEGIEALRRLLASNGPVVSCQALTAEPGRRTLHGSAEELLLECARMADEQAIAPDGFTELELDETPALPPLPSDPLPSEPEQPPVAFTTTPVPAPAPADGGFESLSSASAIATVQAKPDDFGDLFERGVQAGVAKQYQQALEAFTAALVLRPDDRRTQANIARLQDILAKLAQES